MDTDVTVHIRIEHEDTSDVLLEETVEFDVEEHVTLNDDVEFPYGEYQAEFDGDDLPEQDTWKSLGSWTGRTRPATTIQSSSTITACLSILLLETRRLDRVLGTVTVASVRVTTDASNRVCVRQVPSFHWAFSSRNTADAPVKT
ncbi:hypothetical protein D8S78_07710 [Natrialba swarupiae]|nr:hypothetical protein [Natrialba swarupiae]